MSFDTGDSIRRLVACGLTPTQSKQIVQEITHWSQSSGEEWTVARIKSLKVDYLRRMAGLPPIAPWVARHPSGKPVGAFGILWKFSKREMFKCWNALMCYTGFEFLNQGSLRMTERQFLRFLRAVRREQPDEASLATMEVLVSNCLPEEFGFPTFRSETGSPLLDYVPSPSKRAPLSYGTAPEVEGVIDSMGCLAIRSDFTDEFWWCYQGVLKGLEPMWQYHAAVATRDAASSDVPLVGSISWIQEPGYKLRFVANPYRVHQMALKPLGDYLFSLLKYIPNDCTYDQEKGVRYSQEALLQGKTAHCYDLSNATDNFPLSTQLFLLRGIGVPEKWVSLFERISHGHWNICMDQLPTGIKTREELSKNLRFGYSPLIQWSVGQPLGVYPSFASFALCHHYVIRGIFVMLGKEPDYLVLGDDVIIFDDEVAKVYSLVMRQVGVPISPDKTIISDKFCEFAGRVIFPDSVLRGYKWRGRNDNSFIDVARNLGPGSMRLFKRRQRRILRILGPIPEPYGFGWNPKGLDYWERLEPWLDALERGSETVRTYKSRAAHVNTLLYNSNWHFTTLDGLDPELASDQEAQAFLAGAFTYGMDENPAYLIATLLPNVEYLLRLLDDGRIPPDKVIDKTLLTNGHQMLNSFSQVERISQLTELIRYERKLRVNN